LEDAICNFPLKDYRKLSREMILYHW